MNNLTCIIQIGRRVPKSWFRRQVTRVQGLITFQENLWTIIKQALNMAKKKANSSGKLTFIITRDRENEDLNYEIEWIKVIIQGTKEQELEEYNDSLKLYEPLGKILKRDIPQDENMKRHFKTKMLNTMEVEEAYKEGYGSVGNSNLSNKLLEMGILTHVKLIDDYETRKNDVKTDF